ncbi:MAG TPA: M20/M25/M40 family metallo-hydrolase [Candidatus Saccharimonadales bacterium]|nr:M20/M25/M40 family metallo-hydrolase [Candidatus Saccharimonadales bacterium]
MSDSDSLVTLLDTLVAFSTVDGDDGAMSGCFHFLQAHLRQNGMHIQNYEINGYHSLVATTRDTKSPKVLLQAHLDVVPAKEEQFSLQVKGNKLYGRGVFDMKFAAAAFLRLAEDLGPNLSMYDFGIMLTSDEEVGGENGVKALLGKGYRANVCILPDGGEDWQIEAGVRGIWFGKLIAHGKPAHGAHPWEGDNAIVKLVATLNEIIPNFKNRPEDMGTLTLTGLSAGMAINQGAGEAEASFDIRTVDKGTLSKMENIVNKAAAKNGVEVETVMLIQPFQNDLSNPYISSFMKIAADVIKKPVGTVSSNGSSDARFFNDVGIPCVLTRPTGGLSHSDDEWLSRTDFKSFYAVIKRYIEENAQIKSSAN